MSRTFSFTHWLQRDDDEIEVAVTYFATPHVDATYWQPAEGGEVELIEAVLPTGTDGAAPITDEEEALIIAACEDRAGSDLAEHYADAAEYRAEQRADALMKDRWEQGA